MLRRPLQQPYDGPFKVLQRKDKVFFLDINGKRVSVSIDRCKPAFFLNTEDLQLPQTKNETPATVEPNATASTPATVESDPTASTPTQPSTRSGRKVHLPTRFRSLVSHFVKQSSVVDRPGRGAHRNIRSKDKLETVLQSVADDPSVSTRHHSSQLGISRTMLHRIFLWPMQSRILICGFNKMEQLRTLLGK
ncbi:hypothetical protein TNCV_816521 [Trichonephila clavipes]|nr:hypothetical protein TNCV_816521 [Trichonephila clavipes]